MDKFYVITNKSKDVTLEITERIKAYLESLMEPNMLFHLKEKACFE